jgi:hypothetical protein
MVFAGERIIYSEMFQGIDRVIIILSDIFFAPESLLSKQIMRAWSQAGDLHDSQKTRLFHDIGTFPPEGIRG